MNRYLQRHPRLLFKRGVVLDAKRVKACTKANLTPWFLQLKELLDSNLYDPNLLFNLDETSVNFTNRYKVKPIGQSTSSLQPQITQPVNSITATLVLCVAGIGKPLPPTLLWNQRSIPEELRSLSAFDIQIIANNSGWQTDLTFEQMMLEIYIPAMIERREKLCSRKQILLVVDGHGSRVSLATIFSCMRWGITILVIPAHTSSEIQPLDLGINGAFKASFAKEAALKINGLEVNPVHLLSTPQRTVSPIIPRVILPRYRVELAEIPNSALSIEAESQSLPQDLFFQKLGNTQTSSDQRKLLTAVLPRSLEKALTIPIISASWERSGIYPFNPPRVLDRLPEGEQIEPPKTGKPILSGRILTTRSVILEILEWKERHAIESRSDIKILTKDIELDCIYHILTEIYEKIVNVEKVYHPSLTLRQSQPQRPTAEEVNDYYSAIQNLRDEKVITLTVKKQKPAATMTVDTPSQDSTQTVADSAAESDGTCSDSIYCEENTDTQSTACRISRTRSIRAVKRYPDCVMIADDS